MVLDDEPGDQADEEQAEARILVESSSALSRVMVCIRQSPSHTADRVRTFSTANTPTSPNTWPADTTLPISGNRTWPRSMTYSRSAGSPFLNRTSPAPCVSVTM